jgi:predicted transcriptional regulator
MNRPRQLRPVSGAQVASQQSPILRDGCLHLNPASFGCKAKNPEGCRGAALPCFPAPRRVDRRRQNPYIWGMEVHFTSEQEAQLSQIANHSGTDPEQLVKSAALRLLEEDARFRAGVKRGLDAAARGDFIEEEEMDARIERMLQS